MPWYELLSSVTIGNGRQAFAQHLVFRRSRLCIHACVRMRTYSKSCHMSTSPYALPISMSHTQVIDLTTNIIINILSLQASFHARMPLIAP